MKDEQHEQLFTELTPEQAAVIEGGKTLRLYSLKCIKAGADPEGPDEAYFNFGGKIIPIGSMDDGSYSKPINKSYGFEGTSTLSLYDDDASNSDDLIGSVPINGATGFISREFRGSGSTYVLNYQVL